MLREVLIELPAFILVTLLMASGGGWVLFFAFLGSAT